MTSQESTDNQHVVEEGECIHSIALENGFFWETIWDHVNNDTLKQNRDAEGILRPGDLVYVPDLTQKQLPGSTEQRHRFVRKGEPAFVKIRIFHPDSSGPMQGDEIPPPSDCDGGSEGEGGDQPSSDSPASVPWADARYLLTIDGKLSAGVTDGQGYVKSPIPGNAKSAVLKVGTGPEQAIYRLQLGFIDPITEVSGAQQRLNNLGYICGESDGSMDDSTRVALRSFQKKYGIDASGNLDDATKQKLTEIHES